MIKSITSYFCLLVILSVFLSSCNGLPPTPDPIIENHQHPEPIEQISKTEIEAMAECWLLANNTGSGKWVGDGQCTSLARLLTNAPGYGEGNGGIDYLKLQKNKGVIYPKLVDYRDKVKPCDNLILVGAEYLPAGHTVVVFYPDLINGMMYYLDQNYNGEPVRLRPVKFSEIENNAYVISSDCRKPINTTCFSVSASPNSTPLSVQSLDIVPTQDLPKDDRSIIETQGPVLQEIIIGSWPILYNSNNWLLLKKNLGYSTENILENRNIPGCILEPIGEGHGLPMHWEKDEFLQNFGGEVVNVTKWTDPKINKPALIIYDYPPYNGNDMRYRLSVLLYHEILKVGLDIESCIKEVDNVITQSVNR
ncbi:hypothetical protein ATHL_00004 [Anaerolinea thermolimosa]|nr:hypothetical protein ATHL_00004 [Anaerolinea thermolimosa]